MSEASPWSRRAWLRAALAAPALGLATRCGSPVPRPAPTDARSLLDGLALADLDHGGPFIELGSVAKDRHVLGGWRTGWGEDHEVDGRPATMITGSPALLFLDHPGGDEPYELRVALRAASQRSLSLWAGEAPLGERSIPQGTWTTARAPLPRLPAGPLVLSIRHDGAPGEPAFAVSHAHLARPGSQGDPPRLDALAGSLDALTLRAPTRLAFHLDLDRETWLEASASGEGTLRVWQQPARAREPVLRAERTGDGPLRARLTPDGLCRVTLEVESGELVLARPTLRSLRATPKATKRTERVLVVMCDTLRADRLRTYAPDTRVHAPALERLAEESVIFERCATPANWTKPACASLLTGRVPARHGALGRDDPLPSTVPTIAEALRDAGWRTGAFVANAFVSVELGLGRGFDTFEGYRGDRSRHRAGRVLGDARRFLRAHRAEPTFVYAHCVDPHVPYDPPPADLARYDDEPYAGPIVPAQTGPLLAAIRNGEITLDARDRRRLEALYDGEVTSFDRELGHLLDGLRADGWLDDALVVFVADHGEELFDHGSVGHGHSMQEELLHVPLLVRPPGGAGGIRARQLVSLTDLAATILDVAGVAAPEGMDGRSLAAELHGAPPPPDLAVFASQWATERGDELKWSVRIDDLKLWTVGPLESHLHDLAADPRETRVADLAIAHRALTARLGGHLGDIARRGRLSPRPIAEPLSDELCERLRALGYVDVGRCGG